MMFSSLKDFIKILSILSNGALSTSKAFLILILNKSHAKFVFLKYQLLNCIPNTNQRLVSLYKQTTTWLHHLLVSWVIDSIQKHLIPLEKEAILMWKCVCRVLHIP
jgi:hypothetical protein